MKETVPRARRASTPARDRPSAVGVIPARWGSTRFPGKSLAPICGKPLVLWVVERAKQARRLGEVLVATDDERIRRAVEEAGGAAVMTRPDHPSGTDRIAEAVRGRPGDIVVNIQGDEPLIDPALVDELVRVLEEEAGWDMATAAAPIRDAAQVENPAVVKVVSARDGAALYFSRSVIPHLREKVSGVPETGGLYWRHIGLYAYRRAFLEHLVAAGPCPQEQAEKLEQLRALYLGCRMKVVATKDEGVGVDTPEDVARAEAAMRRLGLA